MKKTTILTTILFMMCVTSGFSLDINLKGKIVNENGVGLSFAVVSLANSGLVDTTNEDGEFRLQNSETVGIKTNPAPGVPRFQGNTVSFLLSAPKQVSLTLNDLNGRELQNIQQGMLREGMHSIAVPLTNYSPGIYLVKLRMGKTSYISKLYSGLPQTKYRFTSQEPPSLLKTTAVVDTLIVQRGGYEEKKIEVTSYIGGLPEISLTLGDIDGMVFIPANGKSYTMGSDDFGAAEGPAHTVKLVRDFWMGATEVTQGEYVDVMDSAYSNFKKPAWDVKDGKYGEAPDIAVWRISPYDAMLYLNALSKREGYDTVFTYTKVNGNLGWDCTLSGLKADFTKNGYRLPTEAEWEFAARGGTTTNYYWGNEKSEDIVKQYEWYEKNAQKYDDKLNKTIWTKPHAENNGVQPVGQLKSNPYGLYDILGNVTEFCWDWYQEFYYSPGTIVDPMGPESGERGRRVGRGGNHIAGVDNLRVTRRKQADISSDQGFRVVRND
ncbi:MAG: SUMF1/EgtB/PvdO family nonheme iron enzyme [Fibrobacteria bacterium]|nr:SUMF1/EgtB/PvdO family nonheme iron enzyme [Fibrobacteria bacterium]